MKDFVTIRLRVAYFFAFLIASVIITTVVLILLGKGKRGDNNDAKPVY